MNPNQKIAKLRENVEDLARLWSRAQRRMEEVEKQITWILCALLLQTLFGAIALYFALNR